MLAAAPISIRLYDPVNDERLAWQVSPEEIGSVLALETDPKDPTASTWVVDEARLKELLQQKSQALGIGRYVNPQETLPVLMKTIISPRDEIKLRVYHDAREHTVKFGETLSSIAEDYGIPYPWIQQANAGSGDNLRAGQKITIPSQDAMIPLTPVENKRIVVSMKDQKLQAFEDGKLKWDWTISTGIPSSPTSPGVFQVQGHDPNAYANSWDLWMPWFVGFYRPRAHLRLHEWLPRLPETRRHATALDKQHRQTRHLWMRPYHERECQAALRLGAGWGDRGGEAGVRGRMDDRR